MELLMIGIDALDPRILMDNINKFPNLKELISNGVFSDYSGYAYGYGSRDNWISIYTGLSPEQHGVKNNTFNVTGKIPIYNDYKDRDPFWKILGENGISVGLWRAVTATPVEKINGYMVGGEYFYEYNRLPRDVETEKPIVIEEYLREMIDFNAPKTARVRTIDELIKEYGSIEEVLKKLNKSNDYYIEGFEYLKKELDYYYNNICNVYDEVPTDVIYFYSSALDTLQHFQQYDREKSIIIDSMIEIDFFIGKMIKRFKPDNVLILSDHGSSSFNDVLGSGNKTIEKESFGLANDAMWLENGQIVVRGRTGGFLSGIHDLKGTFICSGKKFKNKYIDNMRTLDIYPIILELFDIKISTDMKRYGYIPDIFMDKDIINREYIYPDIKFDDICIIQNIEVFNFNASLNELYLKYRFSNITVYCEERYKYILELNPRIYKLIVYKDNFIDVGDLRKLYKKIFIPKKNIKENKWEYLEI